MSVSKLSICNDVPYDTNVRYLGFMFSYDIDMTKQLRLFYGRTNVLFRQFNKCDVQIKLFKVHMLLLSLSVD